MNALNLCSPLCESRQADAQSVGNHMKYVNMYRCSGTLLEPCWQDTKDSITAVSCNYALQSGSEGRII